MVGLAGGAERAEGGSGGDMRVTAEEKRGPAAVSFENRRGY